MQSTRKNQLVAFLSTSFLLFSMFFGAGNLIFPPMLGSGSGENFSQAIIGFLLTGVALPVIAIIAVALTGRDIRDLGARGGVIFATGFACVVYLSIGAFYALPRTGAVSFSTAVSPIFGVDSTLASAIFNAIFFGGSVLLSLNPSSLVDRLGKILTPVLLILLLLLIVVSVIKLPHVSSPATDTYADSPLTMGLLEGYMTMDSLAALAYGIIIVSAFLNQGIPLGRSMVKRVGATGALAGGLLGVIYIGLGLIGHWLPGSQDYSDGAALLTDASRITLGASGQVIFGLIVLLACVTTAVGLLAATSEFFHRLVPAISYRNWLFGFGICSFLIASAGLNAVLSMAAPVIGAIYPIAITVIAIIIFETAVKTIPVLWGFRLSVWTATIISTISAFAPAVLDWLPLAADGFGWLVPTLVAFIIGYTIDAFAKRNISVAESVAV
ncbi:branched-chain amino acid uptake carrier [Corynebacterium kutscheri]|uniref:branched-chain amino acid transport system II carrier protein n=1 Tax=Corynebacterium kutscheri TaxID=35755 RepID=UPI000F6DCF9D|nr:branched-chain amino acid transport system II carrier protein [Corynebacterium kutscheri]VEH79316.1 branched-chain amino acid uptake carrier [Corynebacterium kutscheri]